MEAGAVAVAVAVAVVTVLIKEGQCASFNKSYLSNISLVVKNSRINLELNLLRDLVAGVMMDMDIFISLHNTDKYQKVFKYSLDMCNMLAQRRNNLFKKWFSTFFNAGNFKKYCPVEPNFYFLRNYNYNTLFMPRFLYASKYRVKFEMHQIRDIDRIRDFVVTCSFDIEIK
ncbi:uncharacterized protein LOC108088748 [Drosophila ficusphila]|uniref:uncharacterized protein LOC108088748 n=1 Tax=Drosophila ficusphila TaxID=30025 RepID=UPI0007E80F4C|nr:uncharacterized protein LOC108088748 [Drosophila ficusphila]